MDNLELPLAVKTFIIRMHSDSSQHLSYEISGDGCSATLKLTWTNLDCSGCQGVLCPSRIRAHGKRPRPKSWAIGTTNFNFSSPEESVYFSPDLEKTSESAEEEEETFSPRPVLSISRPDVSPHLDSEPGSSRASSHQTPPDILEGRVKVTREHTLDEGNGGADLLSTLSESYDDDLYTEDTMSDDYRDSDLDEATSYQVNSSSAVIGLPYPMPKIIKRPEEHDYVSDPVAIMVDRCDQTDDMVRVVKRCHALLATMEQLYLYYDDRDHILRVSEIDKEEHVLKTRRTEATLKTLLGQDGEALRVTLEIIWIGIELDTGW